MPSCNVQILDDEPAHPLGSSPDGTAATRQTGSHR